MENIAISKEVYEQVKAQVLEELKEERRARAKKREEEYDAIRHMFDPFRKQFYLRLIKRYERMRRFQTNLRPAEYLIDKWYEEAENLALRQMHETTKSAYKRGRAKEANDIACEIMEAILRDGKEAI